ncbi:MAG TPA: hypothetical protein VF221_12715 [Chloroflexota bacterium]
MKCMAIDYHGDGRFKETGSLVGWNEVAMWAKSVDWVRDVKLAGFTAIYAVTCTLGGKHHYLVQEPPELVEASLQAHGEEDSQGGNDSQ